MYDNTVQHMATQSFYKPGADPAEVNKIKAGFADGKTARQISEELRIALTCVESFAPAPAFDAEATQPIPEAKAVKPKAKARGR